MKIRTAKLDSFVTMYKRSFEKALPSPEHIRKLSSTGGHGKGRKSIEFGCLFFVQLGDSIAFCLTIQILRCDKKRRHAEDIYIYLYTLRMPDSWLLENAMLCLRADWVGGYTCYI